MDAKIKEDAVIEKAKQILTLRLKTTGGNSKAFDNFEDVCNFLALNKAELEHEELSIMFLNTQRQLIAYDILFNGTLSHCTIYPREVVKRALSHNAAGVVLVHNHPSQLATPSKDDILFTNKIVSALALIDVTVVDHLIVAGMNVYSMKGNQDI